MITYWPNKQSIELNNSIVTLFSETKNKLKYNLINRTKYYLYIDILNDQLKTKLLKIILKEFEKLILDIIELNINKNQLQKLNYKLLCDFIYKITNNFLSILHYNININLKNEQYFKADYKKLIKIEHEILFINLLQYLIFGSISIDKNFFNFNQFYTPYKHVQILFENYIIQISNLSMHYIFKKIKSLTKIIVFLKKYEICYNLYISNRSIALFFNNLQLQNLIYSYIYQTVAIYNSIYRVWLISSKGIITKEIYSIRLQNLNKLSNIQIFILFIIEIKDIVFPKIKKYIMIMIKYIIYIILNLFSNTTILITRLVSSYIQKNNKI